MILKNLDSKKIFEAIEACGFERPQIFAESTRRRTLEIRDRIADCRENTQAGLSIHVRDRDTERTFFSPYSSTEHWIALLQGKRAPIPADTLPFEAKPRAGVPTEQDAASRLVAIESSGRKLIQGNLSQLLWANVRYEEHERRFEILRPEDPKIQTGEETEGEIRTEWAVAGIDGKTQVHSHSFRTSRPELAAEWLAHPERTQSLKHAVEPMPTWPVPFGKIPTGWSSRAIATLLVPVVRGFEADMVLSGRSWLRDAVELPWRFSLTDRPPPGIDGEGTPRADLQLWSEGKPREVASCQTWAERLHRPSSGHCRRATHRNASTLGLWNVHADFKETSSNLLEALGLGIWIQDASTLFFDIQRASIWLRIRESYLVHQGTRGERLEPFDLELDLLSFLTQLTTASQKPETHGFSIEKHGASFLTELTTPSVISSPIEIPGTVPKGYYW